MVTMVTKGPGAERTQRAKAELIEEKILESTRLACPQSRPVYHRQCVASYDYSQTTFFSEY